jgi:hypothetical protein
MEVFPWDLLKGLAIRAFGCLLSSKKGFLVLGMLGTKYKIK